MHFEFRRRMNADNKANKASAMPTTGAGAEQLNDSNGTASRLSEQLMNDCI
jgi:hypothetical protein